MKIKSIYCLLLTYIIIGGTHFGYYPKWTGGGLEATISWDVSGYYMYLPAIFIYNDLKKCAFIEEIIEKYESTPAVEQAFEYPNGNYVMKYSMGQAIQFAPFFFIADVWARNSDNYPADGFSFPYQFMISMGSLLVAFLGLFYLRRVLLFYFSETAAGLSLLAVVLGTNYLNYTAIDGALTHNNLFTIYAILLYQTILFYKNPSALKAVLIGGLVGLAALTRPTEIVSCLLPVFWGINFFSKEAIAQRFSFLKRHRNLLLYAVLVCGSVGSLQLIYWKYVSGDWIVYSYQDQGFSWLSPHIYNGFLSYKAGWLMYTPFHIFSLLGFVCLYKLQKEIVTTCLLFTLLFIYITFSWDVWWYGGALGQRALVQLYPILMFPLASLFEFLIKRNIIIKTSVGAIMLYLSYINICFTHQAHFGKSLYSGQMTAPYFWKIIGKWSPNKQYVKLLDTDEYFEGTRKNVHLVYENNFTNETSENCWRLTDSTITNTLCLHKDRKESPYYSFTADHWFEWLRVSANFKIKGMESNIWYRCQIQVLFYQDDQIVKERRIFIQRLLDGYNRGPVYMDVKEHWGKYNRIAVRFLNPGMKELTVDSLRVESFEEG